MASRDAQDSTLSVHRAFVVHLRAGGRPGRRRFRGRVEHLSSGESMRFTSLKELLLFFASILDHTTVSEAEAVYSGSSMPLNRAGGPSLPALHQRRKENRP